MCIYINICMLIIVIHSNTDRTTNKHLSLYAYIYIYIYIEREREICSHWQLPDVVRTNGVATEVPRFPLINVHGKMFARCDKMWTKYISQHVRT